MKRIRYIILFCILATYLGVSINAQGILILPEEEFHPPDYKNWKIERTENFNEPEGENLEVKIEKFKKPDANEWLISFTLTDQKQDPPVLVRRGIMYFKPDKDNPKIVNMYQAHDHPGQEGLYLQAQYARNMLPGELKDISGTIDRFLDQYIENTWGPVLNKKSFPTRKA